MPTPGKFKGTVPSLCRFLGAHELGISAASNPHMGIFVGYRERFRLHALSFCCNGCATTSLLVLLMHIISLRFGKIP